MASAWVSRPAKQRLEPPWTGGSHTSHSWSRDKARSFSPGLGRKRTRLLLRGESEEEEREAGINWASGKIPHSARI